MRLVFAVVLLTACHDDDCIYNLCPKDHHPQTFPGPCRFVSSERTATYEYDHAELVRVVQTAGITRVETTFPDPPSTEHERIISRVTGDSHVLTTTWTFDETHVTSVLEVCTSPSTCFPSVRRAYDRAAFQFASLIWSDMVTPRAYIGMVDDDGAPVTATIAGNLRTQRSARGTTFFELDGAHNVLHLARYDASGILEEDTIMRYDGADQLVERTSTSAPPWAATYDEGRNLVEERSGANESDLTRIVYDYSCW